MALSQCACEMKFIIQLLKEMNISIDLPAIIWEDNAGAIFIANNEVIGQRTKHFETRCHFIRELIDHKLLKVIYDETVRSPADLFTKNLSYERTTIFTDFIMNYDVEIPKKGGC